MLSTNFFSTPPPPLAEKKLVESIDIYFLYIYTYKSTFNCCVIFQHCIFSGFFLFRKENRHIFAIPSMKTAYLTPHTTLNKFYQAVGLEYIPANRRRHYLKTGAGIMIKDANTKTFKMLAKFSGKFLQHFFINLIEYNLVIFSYASCLLFGSLSNGLYS